MQKRELLSPAHDTASRAIVDVQTAITRVKAIVSEGVSKGWTETELTARLNKAIATECKFIADVGFREQFRKALVVAVRKWHYELKQTYRILDRNFEKELLKQPLNIELQNLKRKTPYEKQVEFRRLLDDGTNPGIPVIKDYQQSVKLAVKALSADPPKIVTTRNGKAYVMPARLRAELAIRYAAAVENLQRLIDDGVKFCWISSHPNCSPRCAKYQGKLYSLFQGKVEIDGQSYGESGSIDGIPYRPINEALAGPRGDGNGCISGYGCRHRAIEYERGSRAPEDFSEAEIKREYAIDKQQRAYENRIRQMKQEEKQLRAVGMTKEAAALRKEWRKLTLDYQIYSVDNNRAFYPYRCVIDKTEETIVNAENLVVPEDKTLGKTEITMEVPNQHIPISKSLGKASSILMEKFDIKSQNVIITDRQYKEHIAKGANNHDDIYEKIKNHIPNIIDNPDYIFQDDKREDTVIFISRDYQAQIVVKLNTKDDVFSNTIITIFGCSDKKIRQNLRNKSEKLLYKKDK